MTLAVSNAAWAEAEPADMAWTTLKHSREAVNAASKALLTFEALGNEYQHDYRGFLKKLNAYNEALPIINNWRAAHSFPLNTFRVNLNRNAASVDGDCLTAQRIKRLSSISLKLTRFPDMKLSQMQDIGGCRAVVKDIGRVHALANFYRKKSQVKHKLVDADDYIAIPRDSGYRGIHLIWRYESDKRAEYNGLKIEMQLRTAMQHAWATAVETVGTFLEEALKSSIGSPDWLRFFALMGTAVADREGTPPVPGTPSGKDDWSRELYHLARSLNVEHRLYGFSTALQIPELPEMKDAAYFLLHLNRTTQMVNVHPYTFGQLEKATNDYLEAEKEVLKNKNADAVLVSVSSVAALRRAYPNYFADTHVFAQLVRDAVSQHHTEPTMI